MNSTSKIAQVIRKFAKDRKTTFVFSTGVAAESWANYVVRQSEHDEAFPKAIEADNFIAWDTFKGRTASSQEENKTSVPALLRKLYARQIINENTRIPAFKVLLSADYPESALSFTDWLAKLLPSLQDWHERYCAATQQKADAADEKENQDLELLYKKYSAILKENDLFEPSWIQKSFESKGIHYILFYPEALEDFFDYETILCSSPDVTLVTSSKEIAALCEQKGGHAELDGALAESQAKIPQKQVFYCTSVRTELRILALKILSMHKAGMPWSDIAVSVKDIETYRPYLEREFKLYGIPFVMRSGIPYTSMAAGKIFCEMQDCVASRFSYDSVRALLLDGNLPWKEAAVAQAIVREGHDKHCLCSYESSERSDASIIDPWTCLSDTQDVSYDSADKQSGTAASSPKQLYNAIKTGIETICKAPSFKEVQKHWFQFRNKFLDDEQFSQESNQILGKCLDTLSSLISIEKEFLDGKGLQVEKAYSFFLNELQNTQYIKQTNTAGVSVFPYKTTVTAYFPCQYVIAAGQSELTVKYTRFPFLSKAERCRLLKNGESDVSDLFVRLYNKDGNALYSVAKEALGTTAIPFSSFETDEDPVDSKRFIDDVLAQDAETQSLLELDCIKQEHNFLATQFRAGADRDAGQRATAMTVFPQQFNSFAAFAARQKSSLHAQQTHTESAGQALQEQIVLHSKNAQTGAAISISQSDMNSFFRCPRCWTFTSVLHIKEDSLDTQLVSAYDIGNINHKLLELFLSKHPKLEPLALAETEDELLAYLLKPEAGTATAFTAAKSYCEGSPLVRTVLESQASRFASTLAKFIVTFYQTFPGYRAEVTEGSFVKDEGSYELNGKSDLILSSPDGNTLAIVDYKSYNVPAAKNCVEQDGVLADFQMAMYVTLVEASDFAKGRPVEQAMFAKINADKKPSLVIGGEKGTQRREYDKTLEVLKTQYTDIMAQEITQNKYSMTATDSYQTCSGCKYTDICRSRYSAGGVNLAALEEDTD